MKMVRLFIAAMMLCVVTSAQAQLTKEQLKQRKELKSQTKDELNEKASQELLDDISTGDMADVRAYYISEGFEEADEKVAEAFGDLIDQEMYKDAVEEAYEEAHNEVIKTVDEEWEKIRDEKIRELVELGEPQVFKAYQKMWNDAAAVIVPIVHQVQTENGIDPYTPEEYADRPGPGTEVQAP